MKITFPLTPLRSFRTVRNGSFTLLWVLFVVFTVASTKNVSASPHPSMRHHHASEKHRSMQLLGDPDMVFPLDDVVDDTSLGGLDARVVIYDIACTNLRTPELQVGWNLTATPDGTELLSTLVDIFNFSFECDFSYTYNSSLPLTGGGDAILYSAENNLTAILDIASPGTEEEEMIIGACRSEIRLVETVFLTPEPLAATWPTYAETLEDDLQTMLCGLLREKDGIASTLDITPLTAMLASFSSVDPLLAEQELVVPDNADLVNFQGPEGWPGIGVNAILSFVGPYLRRTDLWEAKDVADRSVDPELNINELLRSFLLDDDGTLKITLGDTDGPVLESEDGSSTLRLQSANIAGLDRFTKFDGFTTLGKHTVEIDIANESLEIQFTGELEAEGSRETIAIDLVVGNLDFRVAILLAVDEVLLGEIPLSAFLDIDAALKCILASVFKFDIADTSVKTVRIKPPTSPSQERLEEMGIKVTLEKLVDGILPQILDVDTNETSAAACRPPSLWNPASPFIDFRDLLLEPEEAIAYGGSGLQPYGDILSSVKSFIDNELLTPKETTGELGINTRVIAPITEEQSGVKGKFEVTEPFTLLNNENKGKDIDSRVELIIKSFRLQELDTVEAPVAILDPIEFNPSVLNSSLAIAPFKLEGVFEFALEAEGILESRNEVLIELDVDRVSILLTFLVTFFEQPFLEFPIGQIFDLNCWLAAIPPPLQESEPTASLLALAVNLGDLSLSVSCTDCSGLLVKKISEHFSSRSTSDNSTESLNQQIDGFLSMMRGKDSLLQERINNWLRAAPQRCSFHPDFDPDSKLFSGSGLTQTSDVNDTHSTALLVALFSLTLAFVLGGVFLYLGVSRLHSKRYRKWLHSLSSERVNAIFVSQEEDHVMAAKVDSVAHSMFDSAFLPLSVRILVPLVSVGSSVVFLIAIFSPAVRAYVYVKLIDQDIIIENFDTAINKLVSDMWTGNARLMASLTGILSIVWPHVNNMCTIALWFLPPSIVSATFRLSIMWWLNALGKWSAVIFFIILISTSTYRITIESSVVSTTGVSLYRIDLVVIPVLGLYLWCVGQILAQMTGQVFMHHNRRVISLAEIKLRKAAVLRRMVTASTFNSEGSGSSSSQDNVHTEDERNALTEKNREDNKIPSNSEQMKRVDLGERCVLNKYRFSRFYHDDIEKLSVRPIVNKVVVAGSVAAVVLVLMGCILPSLSYDTSGLIATLSNAGSVANQPDDKLSVVSIAQLLVDQARYIGDSKVIFGLGLLAAVLITIVVAVPIFHVAALLVEWFYPLDRASAKKMQIIAEHLQAWQYAEVYLLSAFSCALQMQKVSAFFVGRYCQSLDAIFVLLVNFGLLAEDDVQCFLVTGSVEYGALYLLLGMFIVAALRIFVAEAVDQRLRDNVSMQPEKDDSEPCSSEEDRTAKIHRIEPPPVTFADRFRWFLRPGAMDA